MDSDSSRREVLSSVVQFVKAHDFATLSTISERFSGYPFGSLAPFALDSEAQPIIHISLLSQHYKNLVKNPRASLFILDSEAKGDVQSFARVCLLGEFREQPQEEIFEQYWQKFPQAQSRMLVHDFRFFKMRIDALRWIGGFGEIRWIEPGEYTEVAKLG